MINGPPPRDKVQTRSWLTRMLFGEGLSPTEEQLIKARGVARKELEEERAAMHLVNVAERKQAGEIGYREGYKLGTQAGYDAAYIEQARELGMLRQTPPPVTEMAAITPDTFDFGPHANVYVNSTDGIVYLRMLNHRGERIVQDFRYPAFLNAAGEVPKSNREYVGPNTTGLASAIMSAIRLRRSIVSDVGQEFLAWQEARQGISEIVRAELQRLGEPVPQDLSHEPRWQQLLCRNYHRIMLDMDSRPTGPRSIMPGEDPVARFPDCNREILHEPWSRLWLNDVPHNDIALAFLRLGLGSRVIDGFQCCRSVQDLLLVTPEEIDSQDGIGKARLRQIRDRLAAHGLALWGDPVPRPQTTSTGARMTREHRSIDLA